jgi:hypothetical protein
MEPFGSLLTPFVGALKPFIRLLLVAIGAGLASALVPAFAAGGPGGVSAAVKATIVAVAVYKGLEWILLRLPYHHPPLRALLDPRARLEGYWLQVTRDMTARPYSLATIRYNTDSRRYMLNGLSADADGNIAASWRATWLLIDMRRDQLFYSYRAEIFDEGEDRIVEGYGVTSFFRGERGTVRHGAGYFMDSQNIRREFTIDRIREEQLFDLIGKPDIESNDDVAALVRAWHARRTSTA